MSGRCRGPYTVKYRRTPSGRRSSRRTACRGARPPAWSRRRDCAGAAGPPRWSGTRWRCRRPRRRRRRPGAGGPTPAWPPRADAGSPAHWRPRTSRSPRPRTCGPRAAGLVEDDGHAVEQPVQVGRVQVCVDEGEPLGRDRGHVGLLEAGVVVVGERVDADDALAVGDQPSGERAAHEPCNAGDQDGHVEPLVDGSGGPCVVPEAAPTAAGTSSTAARARAAPRPGGLSSITLAMATGRKMDQTWPGACR